MTIKEVIKKYGKWVKDPIDERLNNLGNSLFGNQAWEYVPGYDSNTDIAGHRAYYVSVGKHTLTNGNGSDYYRAGYVQTVVQMFHESRHVRQNITDWSTIPEIPNLKNIRRSTDIVRRLFVSEYFPNIRADYSKDPCELDAELYGIKEALIYFESDPIVSKEIAENIILDIVNTDDYMHASIIRGQKLQSVNDVLNVFDKLLEKSLTDKYDIEPDLTAKQENKIGVVEDLTDKLKEPGYKTYKTAFYHTCKTGDSQDKILEQVIVLEYEKTKKKAKQSQKDYKPVPNIYKRCQRMYKELMNCNSQLDNRFPPSKILNVAIPPDQIQYAKGRKSDEETKIDGDQFAKDIAGLSTPINPGLERW